MNPESRGAVLAVVAALLGWLCITSINLLGQVAALNYSSADTRKDLEAQQADIKRLELLLREEISALRDHMGGK
jgi:cell division protein FtsB